MAPICSGTGPAWPAASVVDVQAGDVEGASAGGVGEGASVTIRMLDGPREVSERSVELRGVVLARTNRTEPERIPTALSAKGGHSHTDP